ncbi:hypothetical protein ACFW4O_19195 [Streptomyces mutabilis]|uniref:hypothetical protein n=1 Tax=Streptomyces TaxID=1883 RepID=UPI0036A445B2
MTGPDRYIALLPRTPHTAALAQDFVSSVLAVWDINGADNACHHNLSALLAQAERATYPTVQVSIERQPEGTVRIDITPGATQMEIEPLQPTGLTALMRHGLEHSGGRDHPSTQPET